MRKRIKIDVKCSGSATDINEKLKGGKDELSLRHVNFMVA